jgi:hypothetical protein
MRKLITVAVLAVVAYLVYRWYQNRQATAAATATPAAGATPPAADEAQPDMSGGGGGGSWYEAGGSPDTGGGTADTPPAPQTSTFGATLNPRAGTLARSGAVLPLLRSMGGGGRSKMPTQRRPSV